MNVGGMKPAEPAGLPPKKKQRAKSPNGTKVRLSGVGGWRRDYERQCCFCGQTGHSIFVEESLATKKGQAGARPCSANSAISRGPKQVNPEWGTHTESRCWYGPGSQQQTPPKRQKVEENKLVAVDDEDEEEKKSGEQDESKPVRQKEEKEEESKPVHKKEEKEEKKHEKKEEKDKEKRKDKRNKKEKKRSESKSKKEKKKGRKDMVDERSL